MGKPKVLKLEDEMNREIIDCECKGNVVRFYLGKNGQQWGEDWDNAPYQLNADPVDSKYVEAIQDVAFDFDAVVVEPSASYGHAGWCKKDMIERRVPCLIVIPAAAVGKDDGWYGSFERAAAHEQAVKYYFGDRLEPEQAA